MARLRGPRRRVPIADATAAPARADQPTSVASMAAVRKTDQVVTRRSGQTITWIIEVSTSRSRSVCRNGAAVAAWLSRSRGHPIITPVVRHSSIMRRPWA